MYKKQNSPVKKLLTKSDAKGKSLKIILAYLLFGFVWIIVSNIFPSVYLQALFN